MSPDEPPRADAERSDRLRRWSIVAYAAVAAALLIVAGLGLVMGGLEDTITAFIKGEGLYSEAEKEAVSSLEEYARTGEPEAWSRYQEAVQVPVAARQAREALQRDPPDRERARQHFVQLGLESNETDGMIRLFSWLSGWDPVDQSIDRWTQADSLVAELRAEGRRIHSQWQTPPPDRAALDRMLDRVATLEAGIADRRQQFRTSIDRAGDLARQWGQAAIIGLTVLLLVLMGNVIRRFYGMVREREDRFRQMSESIGEVFWLRPADGSEMLYISPAFEEVWGRPVEELYQRPASWLEAVHPEDRDRVREAALEGAEASFEVEYRILRPDGEVRWIQDQGFPVEGAATVSDRIAGVARDITDRKQLEERLRHRSFHDPLTGLANRSLLQDRLEQGLARSRRYEVPLGLLMLDVDDFKRINDELGHTAGDDVLSELARRLEEAVREEDTVARWGGDEFVIVLPELAEPDAVSDAWERLRTANRSPIEVHGEPVHVDLTVGAAVHSDQDRPQTVQAQGPEELTRFASLALHWAKEDKPEGFSLFDSGEQREGAGPIQREDALRRALERGEILPHYQAIVRLDDRSLMSVEALARWRHPEEGILGPGEFIPLAEQLGLIAPLQETIVRQGCSDLMAREKSGEGETAPKIRFNVSGEQFRDPVMAEDLEQVVRESGARPEQVIVEVTETSLMQVPATVDALQEAGFEVSIDDFGTGYSTLTYLRDLDIDELKIDMTFVQGITGSPSDAALADTMLTLGERLDLRVVAEGIETEGQLREIRSLGCTFGQGYLFGRPGSLDEITSRGTKPDDRGE